MNTADLQHLIQAYWSTSELRTNALVFMTLLGAWVLGAILGYERSYRGRAAGMRTYALVCMASAGLTVMSGYPLHWFGGMAESTAEVDPTRVVQGIVTGVGFLGAGVIMREGLNISGLTTAASIWVASAIGVLVGVGFFASAILLTLLSAATMIWSGRLEGWLPARPAIGLTLQFPPGHEPGMQWLDDFLATQGYQRAKGSLSVQVHEGRQEWRLVALMLDRAQAAPLDRLAQALQAGGQVSGFSLTHARN
ncbi:MgtC/SapB family protein [Ideonella livida]|uniref:Protein MgtC n=1 Tax=Ideonella livida TaxID=2707176 RepID=A0A7C9TNS3_9BURK|nr:MgtC/SapB family protein [Ideonella livida]NDY92786.1 MgtC/SapB family protein [Ideonella livida]